MNINQYPKKALLRCRPVKDLLNEDVLKSLVDKTLLDQENKELRIVLNKLDLEKYRVPGTKSTFSVGDLEESSNASCNLKRSKRISLKTKRYKSFTDDNDESSDTSSESEAEKLPTDSSSSDSELQTSKKRKKTKSKRSVAGSSNVFSDFSDVDETYCPSKDESLQYARIQGHSNLPSFSSSNNVPRSHIFRRVILRNRNVTKQLSKSKSPAKDIDDDNTMKIEIVENNVNISDSSSGLDMDMECKEEPNDMEETIYTKKRKSRIQTKLVFEEDTATEVSTDGEGEEFDISQVRGRISKKIWHKGYGYIISRTVSKGIIYMRCYRGTCKGTAYYKKGRIYSGFQKHDHSRRQDNEVRLRDAYKAELYKLTHERLSATTREIYDLVGEKYPTVVKNMPFIRMNHLMRRWRRSFESQDTIGSLSQLSDAIQRTESEQSSGFFFSGKVVSSKGHIAIILGTKQMIQDSFGLSKLMYIDVNTSRKGAAYIAQIVTAFCITREKVLPVCYVLMENNSEELYESVFGHIKEILAPSVNPGIIICDYEQNLRKVLTKIYASSNLNGHFFHFAQRIYQTATKLNLISIAEGEIANNTDSQRNETDDTDRLIMQYYGLALLPEEYVKHGVDYLKSIQPDSFNVLTDYINNQWINQVGIEHFALFKQIYRANDVFDVYYRKINDILKTCSGPIKIYDGLERYHEFIKKQCTTLGQRDRVNHCLSKQNRLFHPFLKIGWDNLQSNEFTVPQFLDFCVNVMRDMHHIFKYWHVDNVIETELVKSFGVPFLPKKNIDDILITTEALIPKEVKDSTASVRHYSKISPNREIRYRNANVFRHDGYAYNRQNVRETGRVVVQYMACRVAKCNGTLIIKNDVVTPGKNGHNHPKEEVHNSERIMVFKQQLRELIRVNRNMATTEIYKIAAEKNPEGAEVYSPRLAIQSMGRWKREMRSSVVAEVPSTLSSLHDLLLTEEGKQLFAVDSAGVNYYSGTVKTTTGQCAVVFGDTQWITDNFKASQNWIIDTNYRGASKEPFVHHVLIVFSLSREHVLPIAFILMEDRTADLYTAVFSHIKKNLAPGIYPAFIMCDYDEIIHNAIKDVYTEATLQGSLFHYAQAIYRKANSLKIIPYSNTDSSIHSTLLKYYALALLPADLIESGLEILQLTQKQEHKLALDFTPLHNYVKSHWLERVGTAHMSTFMQGYRTSNVLELFQRVFNDKLSGPQPPIFELLEQIQKLHNISKGDCGLLRKSKRQYLDRIGQRFDRLIDFKINTLWKSLSSQKISVEGFLEAAVYSLESLHFVYNTWDLHNENLDIKAPLMIEDAFIKQSDDEIRAAVLCIETDDVKNTMLETTTDRFDRSNKDMITVYNNGEIKIPDMIKDKMLKKTKPKGRVMPSKSSLNAVWQDGYSYYGNKVCQRTDTAPERQYLQCRVKGCRGTAVLVDGEFQLGKMDHNHKRDLNKEQVEEFKKTIKDMVSTQPLTNREIYDLAATMNPSTASLVSFNSLESLLRRWRNARYIPIIPTKLSDIDRILTDAQGVSLVHTRNGSFYSGTVTIESGACAVVLCENYFVKQLMSSTNMYVERNCRCAPRDVQVDSVVAIMFLLGFQVVPVAYILMEDDSEELYYAAFKYFKETLAPNMNPIFIMCDYDEKLHNVFGRLYCDSNIQGCFFHFAQAIYRKAYAIGLIEDCELHENSKMLRQYYALALLPAESMASGLQYLNEIQPKGFIELWKYVKAEWLDPIGSEHLSVYKQPFRCNDVQQLFHKRHNGILEEPHPGIIHLIVHLKKTHDSTTCDYGSRLKRQPSYTIRKCKQLFHASLNLLWKRLITPEPAVDKFIDAAEAIMNDLHYVFHTWDREEHVADITVPYMRNCAFVLNPDSVIPPHRLLKKDLEKANLQVTDGTDAEHSAEEPDEPEHTMVKKGKVTPIRFPENMWKDGYGFHAVKKDRANAAGQLVTYIRCRTPNCRVRGSVLNDTWNLSSELHNHSKDIYAEEDYTFRTTLKQMIRDQPLSIDEIYNLVASLYPEAAERSPMKKIRPVLIRWKRKFVSQVSTNAVSSLLDMDQVLIGDSAMRLVQTEKGSVYSGNVQTSSGHCALVFAQHQFIHEAFLGSTNLYIDSNYRCTPQDPFVDQVLIFFSVCRDHILPFAYVLMSSNSQELFFAVFKYIKETVAPNINPEYVMCDYDVTLHNTIRQIYNSANIHGCFYHFAQSVYRKALSCGIMDYVQTDNEHYFTLMQYYTLPLLPKDEIETAFHHLSLIQPSEFKILWMYVREQWLDRVGVAHLSMFGQPYRVNATFEVFSRKLNDMSKEEHPNIYDLVTHLVKIHQQVYSDYDLLRRGRHAQRVGRVMDRLFHADLRRAWGRLGDSRISAINFMQMAVEYMTNTHFVFSSWDTSKDRAKSDEEGQLPYMLNIPFKPHWCVDIMGGSRARATGTRRSGRTAKPVQQKEYASEEENCDDFDNTGNDSGEEVVDPMTRFESDPTPPTTIIVQQEQVVAHIPTPTVTADVVTNDKKLCLLCNAQNRTHACIPCGHLAYCVSCSTVVSRRMEIDKKCPICQAQYMIVLEIHF